MILNMLRLLLLYANDNYTNYIKYAVDVYYANNVGVSTFSVSYASIVYFAEVKKLYSDV